MLPEDERALTLLSTLVEKGLLSPEEAATLVTRGLGPDPEKTILESGLVEREALATALEGPTRRSAPAGPAELRHVDPWRSPLAAGRDRIVPGEFRRVEAGREVYAATEKDLERPAELHLAPAGSPEGALAAAARLHAELAGPAVPVLYEAGQTPEGRDFLLVSAPPEPGESLGVEEALRALARVARAVHRAHEKGYGHLGIRPERVHPGRHGQVLLTGWAAPEALDAAWTGDPVKGLSDSSAAWAAVSEAPGRDPFRAPELERGKKPGPAADIYSLGVVLSVHAFGEPYRPVRKKRHRLLPGVPPEVAGIVRRATNRRPSRRYGSALAFAKDLERALAGEPVSAARSPLSRRLARFARRHPYVLLAASVLAISLAAGAAAVAIDRAGRRRVAHEEERRSREEGLAAAARKLEEAAGPTAELTEAIRRQREDPGNEEASLAARIALDRIFEIANEARRLAGESGFPDAEKLLVESAVPQVELDIALARAEEDRVYSSRTISAVRARAPIHAYFQASGYRLPASGKDRAAYEKALDEVAPRWREAALLLERLGDLAPRPDAFSIDARIELGPIPRGLTLRIFEVENGPIAWSLGREVDSLDLPAGDYLLMLEGGEREVRHEVLLLPGEVYEWGPDWPAQFPPGDYAYVPASRFRAGGEAPNAKESSVARVEQGFFIARREVMMGEYIEFLRAVGAREDLMPRYQTTSGQDRFLDANLRITYQGYTSDMPAGGLSQLAAKAYAEWLTSRSGGRWRYRLPTEDEWELGARGAAGRIYPWGDGWEEGRDNLGSSFFVRAGTPESGGSIYGLTNCAGNAREWTGSDYGHGLVTLRGGSAWETEEGARVAARLGLHPGSVYALSGVRLVCAPPEAR
ncbi:MAG: SUMF1/EgtB/PvdO family nonheme iron enzyme [Planctomycetes bacterium]|nr:SUMF1/EgtB/PvdO family nonheme iron enzyme [Planctomycetota bacterium]